MDNYIISFISALYTLTQLLTIFFNLRYEKANQIKECINDAVNFTETTYVIPLKNSNKWSYDNHKEALDLATSKFNLYYENYSGYCERKIYKHRVHRLIQDRLDFLHANNKKN